MHASLPSSSNGGLAADLLKGALAGAGAVWVMDRVDWFNFRHVDPAARRRTERVRPGGLDPAHVAVNRLARRAGMELSPPQPHPAGIAMHYGIGMAPAALYAATRDKMEALGPARAPLFGLALFLLQDEAVNAVTGLSARPGRYPWQAHARGLVAHLVFGAVLELALNAMDRADRSARH